MITVSVHEKFEDFCNWPSCFTTISGVHAECEYKSLCLSEDRTAGRKAWNFKLQRIKAIDHNCWSCLHRKPVNFERNFCQNCHIDYTRSNYFAKETEKTAWRWIEEYTDRDGLKKLRITENAYTEEEARSGVYGRLISGIPQTETKKLVRG